MKMHKRNSKRIPCSHRYRVEKKQKERLRKHKKAARLNPIKPRNPDKDLKVPNLAPFKEKILQEAMAARVQMDEAQKLRKLELRAQKLAAVHEEKADTIDTDKFKVIVEKIDNSASTFVQEFNKVVEKSDVVVQVLDARDPLGTRCKEVERSVITAGKRLLLLLNKCDLIPGDNLKQWLEFLRKELPTLPFKASTQSQRNKISQNRGVNIQALYDEEILGTKRCLGAPQLMKILGNYCRNKDIKTSIKVGIVGYPNVGKSSVINSLKRTKACNTGATPGLTRQAQEVTLDKHIQLIDSPGIVFDKSDSTSAALRNARRVECLEDPVIPALEIIRRANKQQLILQYKLKEDFKDGQEFFALLARARGFIGRGGVYNPDKAARLLINDWNSGKIKYYTVPPEEPKIDSVISTEIVQTFAKEFSLDFDFADRSVMRTLPRVLPSDAVKMDAGEPGEVMDENKEEQPDTEEENEVEEMEDSGKEKKQPEVRIQVPASRKRKQPDDDDAAIKDESYRNLRQNRSLKMAFKKAKKQKKRTDKISTILSSKLEDALSSL